MKRLTGDLMANQRDEVVIEGVAEDVTDIEQDVEDQLASDDTELGSGTGEVFIKYKVYLIQPGSAEMTTLFECAPIDIPGLQMRLIDEYGTGKYEVKRYVSRDGGPLKLQKRYRFSVMAPRNRAKPAGTGDSDLAAAIRAMGEQQQRAFDQMRQMMLESTGRAPAADPIDQMTKMMTALAGVRELIQPRDSLGEFVKVIGAVKEIIPEGGGGGGGGESNMWSFLEKVAPVFGVALESMQNRGAALPPPGRPNQAALPPVTPPAGVQPAPGQQSAPSQPQTQEVNMNAVKAQISMLVNKAANNANPELYAELIIDNVQRDVIEQYLLAPDALDKAAELVPQVNHFRGWFQELQDAVRDYLNELAPQGQPAAPAAAPAPGAPKGKEKEESASAGVILPEGSG